MLYDITYKCGHTAEVDLRGSSRERNFKARGMEKHDCPACEEARIEKQRAAFEEEYHLPVLVGKSEKQVSYARDKRREILYFKLIEQHKSFISKSAQGYEKRLKEEPEHERFEKRKRKFEHLKKQLAAIDEIFSLSQEITSAEFWLNIQGTDAWSDLFVYDDYAEGLIAKMRKEIKGRDSNE